MARKCSAKLAMTGRYSVMVEPGGGPALIQEMDGRQVLGEKPVPDGKDDSLSDCTVLAIKLPLQAILGWFSVVEHFCFASVVAEFELSPPPVSEFVAPRPQSSHLRALSSLGDAGFGSSLPYFLKHSQMTSAATAWERKKHQLRL